MPTEPPLGVLLALTRTNARLLLGPAGRRLDDENLDSLLACARALAAFAVDLQQAGWCVSEEGETVEADEAEDVDELVEALMEASSMPLADARRLASRESERRSET